jgi:hypothetical protein
LDLHVSTAKPTLASAQYCPSMLTLPPPSPART